MREAQVGILDRAREQAHVAAEQARAAAEQARTTAHSVSARTLDRPVDLGPEEEPAGVQDRARDGGGDLGVADRSAETDHLVETNGPADGRKPLRDPLELAHLGLNRARSGLAGVVERIDPGILADVVIKATSLQEAANVSLGAKGSPYRISGISITATIPPQVSFAISRLSIDDSQGPAQP